MKISKISAPIVIAATITMSGITLAADVDQSADINDVAIQGYDPVAYFTESKPVQGSNRYTATHKNAIYYFSSHKNRDLFVKDKTKYAPAYGGFCAFGVAFERKFTTDPMAWKIVDHRLYLNKSKNVQSKWFKDIPGYIESSESNWPEIKSSTDAQLAAK